MCIDIQRTIVLKNGDVLEGLILPLSSARFLVQTPEICLDLSETEIESVDEESDLRQMLEPSEALYPTNHLFELHEDGSMTDCERSTEVHKGPGMKEHLTFVIQADRQLSEEERRDLGEVVDSLEYRDGFGKILPITTKEETENGWKYTVTFDVPLAPSESIELTRKQVWPKWGCKEGDEWVWGYHIAPGGGGRLTTITLKLPKGAESTRVKPEPLRKTVLKGQEVIVWRRYITEDLSFYPQVRYHLDSDPNNDQMGGSTPTGSRGPAT